MKFEYQENKRLIGTLENAKNRDFLIDAEISNLRSCAKISEKTAARLEGKKPKETIESWVKRAIRFTERANELEAYLEDEKCKTATSLGKTRPCYHCDGLGEYCFPEGSADGGDGWFPCDQCDGKGVVFVSNACEVK